MLRQNSPWSPLGRPPPLRFTAAISRRNHGYLQDLKFFVRDAWGESDLRPQAEGLRQGDPLACFLLLILMTVIMLDTRKAFEAICTKKNFSAAAHYMERVFGFHDIEFADDTHFVHTHLLSLRTLTTCYLKEARIYGFRVNNDPETGKCYVLALP